MVKRLYTFGTPKRLTNVFGGNRTMVNVIAGNVVNYGTLCSE